MTIEIKIMGTMLANVTEPPCRNWKGRTFETKASTTDMATKMALVVSFFVVDICNTTSLKYPAIMKFLAPRRNSGQG